MKDDKFNKMAYDNNYLKEHYKRITILIPYKEKEVLDFINSKKSKTQYILDLIRKDMNQNKENTSN